MQGAKCAISKLMYGLSVCMDYNQSLKLVAYRLVHTDEPYIGQVGMTSLQVNCSLAEVNASVFITVF